MSQTSYPRNRAVAVSGMPVDMVDSVIVTYVAAEVIPPGRFVILNGSGQLELPKLSTLSAPVGVSMFDVTRMQPAVPAAGFSYQIGDLVPVMRRGRIYADFSGAAQTALAAANVKHNTVTATNRGKFTDTAVSAVVDAEIDAPATFRFLGTAPTGLALPANVCAVEFSCTAEDTARFQAAELVTAPTQRGVATLVAGTVSITAAKITANSRITFGLKTPLGVLTNTVGYCARGANRVVGPPGTGTFTLEAVKNDGTLNNADLSILDWQVSG